MTAWMRNKMAYFDEKRGEVVLSEEDKEMFKEVHSHFSPKGLRTPVADSIMRKIWGKLSTNKQV